MNILFIGDIFGKLGIEAVAKNIDHIKQSYQIDLVIANGENTTNCRGLDKKDYLQLINLGIDFFTMGNHTWKQDDIKEVLSKDNIIRPYNLDPHNEWSRIGYGTRVIKVNQKNIRITNLLGNLPYFEQIKLTNPFKALEEILATEQKSDIHLVDFHAETTSEKNCALWSFKNRVSAIVGTHTHVQTNDAYILENTAYISDVGMTGPSEGIIGAKKDSLIEMFYGNNKYFRLNEEIGKHQFCAIVLSFDDASNNPTKIQTIFIRE